MHARIVVSYVLNVHIEGLSSAIDSSRRKLEERVSETECCDISSLNAFNLEEVMHIFPWKFQALSIANKIRWTQRKKLTDSQENSHLNKSVRIFSCFTFAQHNYFFKKWLLEGE